MPLTPQQTRFTTRQRLAQAGFLAFALLVGFATWQVHGSARETVLEICPAGVMGTSCTLRVTCSRRDVPRALELLSRAERSLRHSEALTSTWITTSEVSRLNAARAGETVPLSAFTRDFLERSRLAHAQTHGAFDITCGPVWELWRTCAEQDRLPEESEIERLRLASQWSQLVLEPGGARKLSDELGVVSGGVAKGMAIDAALRVLRSEPGCVASALVEVGGDVAAWNHRGKIKIRGTDAVLGLENGGICTSGHDQRTFDIQGVRYSQILDPRTGRPVPTRWTVTVTAPDATTADIWATALEILGPEGAASLPDGVHARFFSCE